MSDAAGSVLVIEDVETNDSRAVAAMGRREALEQPADPPFDLVVLDIVMPEVAAWRCCGASRPTVAPDPFPVILLTARDQVWEMVQALVREMVEAAEGASSASRGGITDPHSNSPGPSPPMMWRRAKGE